MRIFSFLSLLVLTASVSGAEINTQADDALDTRVQAFLDSQEGQWHDYNVPAIDGQILHDLIVEHGFTQAVEIGTSTGYSTIWIAWALSKTGGELVTFEIDRGRYEEAKQNIAAAGLSEFVEFKLGDAHKDVPALKGNYDFVFSDADKHWYINYFDALYPKLATDACFTAHNVSASGVGEGGRRTRGWESEYFEHVSEIEDMETYLHPQSRAGMAVSCKQPWLNEELEIHERAQALLDALTVEEKMQQLLADAPGIPRLGILPYNWWNEALHGVARNGRATVFPQPIGMAATFDDDLIYRVATAISDEARAKFNIAQSMGNYSRYAGLTFWSPNVNIFRDPRWGRGMETYGEDPYLQARMGVAFVKGLQGDDPDHMKTAACAKHYAVHSGPEALRHEFDAVAPRKDFYETYLPAFEALVKEGAVECVMCAYNRTYGEPACGSDLLLKDILRNSWGFQGHVVSDCGAVRDFHEKHRVADSKAGAAAWALKAGTDVNCGRYYNFLPDALEQGLIDESDIDTALRRLLTTRLKLGLFDERAPWSELDAEMVEHEEHVALAREAAQKSIVLLKNRNNTLPLDRNIRKLFIAGPHASTNEVLLGNYYGMSGDMVSILEGIVGAVSVGTTVDYRYGQRPYAPNVNPKDSSTGGAASSDATIVVLGISGLMEGEEGSAIASPSKGDRLDLNLPEEQLKFLRKIRSKSKNPVIVVLTGGSPITMPEVDELADAILFAWYPGQMGGKAVADVLFGDTNPSGRLPITFPRSVDQLPPYLDYSMAGRTYKYMTQTPLYPFGYGLSYTSFDYGELKLSRAEVRAGDTLDVELIVRNSGDQDGVEIVQLYHSVEDAGFDVPLSTLIGFKPVAIPAGAEKTVRFSVSAEQMKAFDPEGKDVFVPGHHTLHAGGVSPGPRGEALTGRPLRTIRFTMR